MKKFVTILFITVIVSSIALIMVIRANNYKKRIQGLEEAEFYSLSIPNGRLDSAFVVEPILNAKHNPKLHLSRLDYLKEVYQITWHGIPVFLDCNSWRRIETKSINPYNELHSELHWSELNHN